MRSIKRVWTILSSERIWARTADALSSTSPLSLMVLLIKSIRPWPSESLSDISASKGASSAFSRRVRRPSRDRTRLLRMASKLLASRVIWCFAWSASGCMSTAPRKCRSSVRSKSRRACRVCSWKIRAFSRLLVGRSLAASLSDKSKLA